MMTLSLASLPSSAESAPESSLPLFHEQVLALFWPKRTDHETHRTLADLLEQFVITSDE